MARAVCVIGACVAGRSGRPLLTDELLSIYSAFSSDSWSGVANDHDRVAIPLIVRRCPGRLLRARGRGPAVGTWPGILPQFRARRLLKRISLVVPSLLVGLVLGEIVLLVLGAPSDSLSFSFPHVELEKDETLLEDRALFWRLNPDAKGVHVNRLRLRGWAPSESRGEHDLRIACAGCSCTYETDVSYEETYGM